MATPGYRRGIDDRDGRIIGDLPRRDHDHCRKPNLEIHTFVPPHGTLPCDDPRITMDVAADMKNLSWRTT